MPFLDNGTQQTYRYTERLNTWVIDIVSDLQRVAMGDLYLTSTISISQKYSNSRVQMTEGVNFRLLCDMIQFQFMRKQLDTWKYYFLLIMDLFLMHWFISVVNGCIKPNHQLITRLVETEDTLPVVPPPGWESAEMIPGYRRQRKSRPYLWW